MTASFTQLNLGADGDQLANIDNGDGTKTALTVLAGGASTPYRAPASATNPIPAQLSVGNAAASATNPVPVYQVPSTGASVGLTWAVAFGTAVSGVAGSGAANLYSCTATSRDAAIRYFQIWDGASAGTGVLKVQIALDAVTSTTVSQKSMGTEQFGPNGINFATGVAWGFSITSGTYSAGTASECDVTIGIK